MFLIPHPSLIDYAKTILPENSDPVIRAKDFVPIIEHIRHTAAPMVHASSGFMRQSTEFWRETLAKMGVKNLFTMALSEICASAAVAELMSDPRIDKPDWELNNVSIKDVPVRVEERDVMSDEFSHKGYDYNAFMGMKHFVAFNKETGEQIKTEGDPVMLIAPNSGHPPEYIDKTVQGYMEQGRDVYVVYCRDAMDIPLTAGRFGLNEYISGLARFTNFFRDVGVHVIPICQPGPPLMAALALMGELVEKGHNHISLPRTIVSKANPYDTDVNQQLPNKFARSKPLSWFQKFTQAEVPLGYGYKGAGRKIYYGAWQIASFMMGKPDSHWRTLGDYNKAVADGHHSAEHKIGNFYGKRFLVPSSLTWEFYIETVKEWFIDNSLAKGTFRFTGEICGQEFKDHVVDLSKVKGRDIGALFIEGEKDDITGVGQVTAMSRLLTGVQKQYYILVKGAGHTGVFRGDNFVNHVCKPVVEFMRAFDRMPTAPEPKLRSVPLPQYAIGKAA